MERHNRIVALDAGSGSVVMAVGRRDADGKLVLEDISSHPLAGITRGEITNRQQMTEGVQALLAAVEQKLGLRVSDVYTGTSGRHVRFAGHDYFVFVGEGSDGEIRSEDVRALHAGMNNVQAEEGLRIMDRIPQKYVVDGRDVVKDPVGRFGRKLDATFGFVLGSATLIDRLEKSLLAMEIRSRKTFAAAIASAEAVLLPEEREMGVAVIDLGAGTTDLCVMHDNGVRFVRGIPFGAGDINSDIHQMGLLEKYVEGLKKEFGQAMASQVDADKLIAMPGRSPREKQEISKRNLATIIENRLREIIGFVMEEIADSGYAGKLRGGVVLTGGGSRLPGIDELFAEATGMEVRLALPDARVAAESLPLAQDPAHATVIGLLLMALEEESAHRSAPGTPSGEAPAGGVGTVSPKGGVFSRRNDPAGGGGKISHAPDPRDEEDDDDDGSGGRKKKRGLFGRLRKTLEDTIFVETLDGDEDL
ncbi:MAG: cell division protein FtsA [Alistipes sp.]|jgi:cell division protein FtsA|nr:cell division protein FtsA [Alistipes sp.]